jgi:hypothetical protein
MEDLEHFAAAFHASGTVQLPPTFPASARVLAVKMSDTTGLTKEMIKVVHRVDEKQILTWIFRRQDLSTVRVPNKKEDGDDAGPFAGWEHKTAAQLKTEHDEKFAELTPGTSHSEGVLHRKAIVHVNAAASVIVRFEFAMTATEAVDISWKSPCPVCPHPPY